MEHAAFVRGSQSSADFARELDGFVLRQTTDAADQRGQVFPVQVLHRNEVRAFQESDVIDAADVGVRDLPGDTHLAATPRLRGFAHACTAEEFQGHRLVENQVVDPIHLAHAAWPDRGFCTGRPEPCRPEIGLLRRNSKTPSRSTPVWVSV